MLCDSTKNLLQSIIQSLLTQNQDGWDDQVESGKQCLYEMHQMTKPSYRAYKTSSLDKWPARIPDGADLSRAMPHVKAMVSAINRRDRTTAIESGRAAVAEMNGSAPPPPKISTIEPVAKLKKSNVVRKLEEPVRKRRPLAEVQEHSKRRRMASAI